MILHATLILIYYSTETFYRRKLTLWKNQESLAKHTIETIFYDQVHQQSNHWTLIQEKHLLDMYSLPDLQFIKNSHYIMVNQSTKTNLKKILGTFSQRTATETKIQWNALQCVIYHP